MIHSNILPLLDTRRNLAISGRTATTSFESERSSTSYQQIMDEYVRKTILSRYDFASGALSIVQDNARTCYCTPPSQQQAMSGKKLKNNNRRRKKKSKNYLSSKKSSQNRNKNENASRRPCRWGSSSSSSVHAINDEGLQSQHTTNSNNRRSPGRWSNGIADFKGKEEVDQHLFATATTNVMKNLTAALAKDLSLSSQIKTSHALNDDEGRLQSQQHTTTNSNNNRRSPGRWSNGIADNNFKGKTEELVDQQHLFATATTTSVVMKNLTAAALLAMKDPSLSSSQITTSHADIIRSLPLPLDHTTGQRQSCSSLSNAITTTYDPRHSLIRPERTPSYEYLNCTRRHSHSRGHSKNGGQNFQWVIH